MESLSSIHIALVQSGGMVAQTFILALGDEGKIIRRLKPTAATLGDMRTCLKTVIYFYLLACKNEHISTHLIPALGWQRQEDCHKFVVSLSYSKFQASQGYITRERGKKKTEKQPTGL